MGKEVRRTVVVAGSERHRLLAQEVVDEQTMKGEIR